jgi:hypothetical protein
LNEFFSLLTFGLPCSFSSDLRSALAQTYYWEFKMNIKNEVLKDDSFDLGLLVLKKELKKLESSRSRIGFKKGGMSAMGSLMDFPIMQPVSSLNSSVIKKLRTSFKRGGFIQDDFSEIQYLISTIERRGLKDLELKLLLELFSELGGLNESN